MSNVLVLSVLVLGFGDYQEEIDQRRVSLQERQDQMVLAKWLKASPAEEVTYNEPARYPETIHLIEDFVHDKTEKHHKVQSIAFIKEFHTYELIHSRIFRAKFTGAKGKEHVIDFLLQKKTAYFDVTAWQRAQEAGAPTVAKREK